MKQLPKIREILHQPIHQNHKTVLWCVIAFGVSVLYGRYEESDIVVDWFLFADGYDINFRGHVYYLGERAAKMIWMHLVDSYAKIWQTEVFFIVEALYFCDYFFFFHTSGFGKIRAVTMIILLMTIPFNKYERN